ncbi:MAG: hypothetical protein ACJ763_08365 [Bdellovibrionia bacterium]
MKSKLILSATLALMVSSSAMASSKVGQTLGADVDHRGTQCVLQQKAQAESNSSRGSADTDGDKGRSAHGRSAD